MCSHNGSIMTLDKGSIMTNSIKNNKVVKQNINYSGLMTLSHILWTSIFLVDKSYHTTGTTVYQDNKSSIILDTNGTLVKENILNI